METDKAIKKIEVQMSTAKRLISRIIRFLAPPHSRRRAYLKRTAMFFGIISNGPPDMYYYEWYKSSSNTIQDAVNNSGPLISIVVPAFNTPQKYLFPFIHSVVAQTYNKWELIIVNASTDEEKKDLINSCAEIDTRILIIDSEKNYGISGNTNIGIEKATGNYICFMDHDDTLHPAALSEIASTISKHKGEVDLIYSDEDKLTEDGEWRHSPHFKPDWSPRLLESVNYITHLVCVRSKIAKELKLRSEFDGSQDYDFLLRLTEKYKKIVHIPKVLYHWREAEGSTAQNISTKPKAGKAGIKALEQHYNRIKISEYVKSVGQIKDSPGFYITKFVPPTSFTIAIKDEVYDRLTDDELLFWDNIKKNESISVIRTENNNSITGSEGVLIFIADYFMPKSTSSLYDLAGASQAFPSLLISPQLLGRDGRIVSTAYAKTEYGMVDFFNGYEVSSNTYFGNTQWNRDTSHVRRAVIAVSSDKNRLQTEDSIISSDQIVRWSHCKFKTCERPLLHQSNRQYDKHGNPNLAERHLIQGLSF